MTKNKGKPSRQVPDQRKELELSESRRTIRRFDRSRSDEKGAKGEPPARHGSLETAESKRDRKPAL